MAINIGATILQIRKEKQITQEQLSEILGVSTTAVCKWETGATHPDIELLPVIAEFFGISVDRLLGYDMCKAEVDIKEQLRIGLRLFFGEEKTNPALAHFSKLAYRYPNNIEVLSVYAHAKDIAAERSDDEQFKKVMQNDQDELLRQCQALAAKMSRKEQDNVSDSILTVHIKRKNFAKAEQILAEMRPDGFRTPPLDYDTGAFWMEVYKDDRAKAECKYFDILNVLHKDVLFFGLHYIYQNRPTQLIKQNNKMIQVYELFMEDFNKKPWWPLAFLHESNAIAYFKLDDKEKAINELKEFAKSIAHIPDISLSCRNIIKQFSLRHDFYGVIFKEEDEEAYEFIKNTYENL